MAEVTDYCIVRDGPFTLETGGDIDATHSCNAGSAVLPNRKSILQFFYVSSTNASNLSFRLRINGTTIRTINVNGNSFGTVHEVVSSGVLKTGNNEVESRIVGGTGAVTISDIVLFVQRDV